MLADGFLEKPLTKPRFGRKLGQTLPAGEVGDVMLPNLPQVGEMKGDVFNSSQGSGIKPRNCLHRAPSLLPPTAYYPAQVASSFLVLERHKVFFPGRSENHMHFPVREEWHLVLNYSGPNHTFVDCTSVFNPSDLSGFSLSLFVSSLPE